MQTAARRQQVTVAIETPLKTALKQMAQRDGRSLSNLVRKLVEEHVRVERSANAANTDPPGGNVRSV